MNRRDIFKASVATAGGLMATQVAGANTDLLEDEAGRLCRALARCVAACNACYLDCLENAASDPSYIECVKRCLDCASLCSTMFDFVSRGSALTPELAELCIKCCEACIEICEQHEGDPNCEACVAACVACVALLREC